MLIDQGIVMDEPTDSRPGLQWIADPGAVLMTAYGSTARDNTPCWTAGRFGERVPSGVPGRNACTDPNFAPLAGPPGARSQVRDQILSANQPHWPAQLRAALSSPGQAASA